VSDVSEQIVYLDGLKEPSKHPVSVVLLKTKPKKHTEIDQQFGTFTLVEMKKYKSSNFEQWTPFLSLEPRCNSGVNK
jgi:hypothetical protein